MLSSARACCVGLALLCTIAASPLVLARPARVSPPRAAPVLPTELRSGRCDDLALPSLIAAIEAQEPQLTAAPLASETVSPAGAQSTAAAESLQPRLRNQTLREYAGRTLPLLRALAQRGPQALCRGLRQRFELVRLTDGARGHLTAYYHPVVRGSRRPSPAFPQPLYRRPPEPLSQLSTAAILDGGLAGQGLELVYVDSLYTALNIHIEGSATIALDEGGELNLTPDGHNGQPYQNPLKLASRDGVVPASQSTAPGQSRSQAFFRQNPEVLRKYWAQDPHFVFFKETPLRGSGRFGQLVAGRSVAVDASQIPLGAVLWLRSELATAKAGDSSQFSPIARLVLAQDTGAAIRGLGRIDLFVGSGPAAQLAAARTSRPAELYLLLPKVPPSRARRRA